MPSLKAGLHVRDGSSQERALISPAGRTGAVYGGVPGHIRTRAFAHLDDRLRGVVGRFVERYPSG